MVAAQEELAKPRSIDALSRLHLRSCPQCGVQFGLPLELWLARRQDGKPIYCPVGHVIETAGRQAEKVSDFAILMTDLLVDLRGAKHENDLLREKMATMRGPAVEVDEAELKRRMKFIVNHRAREVNFGRRACPICESVHGGSGLLCHLRKNHVDEIRAMPAEYFVGGAA
jgi:hypothetical protein